MSQLALHGGPKAVRLPLPPRWPQLSPAARSRVDRLLDAGELSDYDYGPVLEEFERTVADYHGVPYALASSSGTDALLSAYLAVGVGPGDEVLVPSYSFHATVAPLFLLSAVPVLCDVDPVTGNIDLADAESRITERTRAVAVTHLWGHPVDMDELGAMARRHGLKVIEDGSHAHGARFRGRLVGTFADAGVFSLGARKMVSGGMGGVMITAEEEVFRAPQPLGHTHERAAHSWPAQDVAVGLGGNHRIGLVAAAICTEQYRDLDDRIAVKSAVLEGLSERLRGIPGLRPQFTAPDVTRGGWYGYKARYVPDELDGLPLDDFVTVLRAEGLDVDRPSNKPLHWHRMFRTDKLEPPYYQPGRPRPLYQRGDLPGAERYYESCLSFPAPALHNPCDDVLDAYREGVLKVVLNVARLQ
ncbi:DegT/DnrJ/EryC1/StrS aminotransferase family protein [Streptomyces chromofuscus]|uniref:DegT/DnrJ/EryC1/StrS aminotransferase family protein n=1 Tax=Streptomyces chromofuscus TaxID=42881 RepID=UPI0016782FE7|nr:DegT/DnrJ/EryC1/StrS family aminotransferase [Streptomyces chromofuscus]GGT43242.1 aminotransferase DegT [Streptomyces chromofuscus]